MRALDICALIHASYATHALYVLAKNDVFDALVRGPVSAPDLASRSGLQQSPLEQLLQVAVGLGFVRRVADGYRIEKKALALTRASRSWLRSYLLLWGEQLNPAFGYLQNWAVAADDPFFNAHGAKIWDFYRQNRTANERFVEFQDAVTDQVHTPLIASRLRVDDARQLVDIAGGKGSLACAILNRHAQLTGVVFDQQHMRAAVTERIRLANLRDRKSTRLNSSHRL